MEWGICRYFENQQQALRLPGWSNISGPQQCHEHVPSPQGWQNRPLLPSPAFSHCHPHTEKLMSSTLFLFYYKYKEYWRLKAKEKEVADDGVVVTQWTWIWANSRRQWRTEKPGVIQSMSSQRVTRLSDWTTTTRNIFPQVYSSYGQHPLMPVTQLLSKKSFHTHCPMRIYKHPNCMLNSSSTQEKRQDEGNKMSDFFMVHSLAEFATQRSYIQKIWNNTTSHPWSPSSCSTLSHTGAVSWEELCHLLFPPPLPPNPWLKP